MSHILGATGAMRRVSPDRVRTDRQAHFAMAASTYPSESRRPAFYRPAPARRINLFRRIVRAILGAL
jgi:hypothetical protein